MTEDDSGNTSYTALWSSLETFRAAMAGAPANPTSSDVFDAMYTLEDEDLRGPAAPDDELRGRSTGAADQLLSLFRCTDSEFVTFQDDSPSGNSVTQGELESACFGAQA